MHDVFKTVKQDFGLHRSLMCCLNPRPLAERAMGLTITAPTHLLSPVPRQKRIFHNCLPPAQTENKRENGNLEMRRTAPLSQNHNACSCTTTRVKNSTILLWRIPCPGRISPITDQDGYRATCHFSSPATGIGNWRLTALWSPLAWHRHMGKVRRGWPVE